MLPAVWSCRPYLLLSLPVLITAVCLFVHPNDSQQDTQRRALRTERPQQDGTLMAISAAEEGQDDSDDKRRMHEPIQAHGFLPLDRSVEEAFCPWRRALSTYHIPTALNSRAPPSIPV